MTLSQGDRLGRYEILGSIGAGGMGEVWRARDTELDREVAVKVLPAAVADNPDRRKRFEREARATAALNHPNLLTVFDVGLNDGRPYLVTELLEGESLRRVLLHGLPPPVSAVGWSLGISQGLVAAHSGNVVHRDLKPDNVFLTTDNRVKILDFGLAKILETEISDESKTATLSEDTAAGTLLGTMGYMAPEQLRGDPVDTRTDIFAFGCLLYEMLSGRRPFAGGSSADYVSAALRDDPPPLDDSLSVSLRAVVRRCLEKRPAARYQSAGELVAVLEALDPDTLGSASDAQSIPSITAAHSGAEPAVAVMPFANLTNDVEQDYFCDGMSEEILGAIGKIRGLKVLARSSSFAFKGKDADPREVGRTIGADHLLEGSVRRAGDRVRISARLVQATDGTQLWADRYDRTISDIFELQDEISVEVANQLRTALLPDELSKIKRRHIPDREAYDFFLRGRYLWYRRREGDLMQAMGLYQKAIEKDPEFPDPRIGLAEVFNILGAYSYMDPRTAYARSQQLVDEVLVMDPNNAGAHSVRGFISTYHQFDWKEAEQSFQCAIKLDPESAPVRCWYAGHLNQLGRHHEAAEQARRAAELEPMSPLILTLAGFNIAFEDVQEGLLHQRRAIDIDLNHPIANHFLATVLVERLGAYEEAFPYLERAVAGGLKNVLALLVLSLSATGQAERLEDVESSIASLAVEGHIPLWIAALRALASSDQDAYLDAIERIIDTGEFAGGLLGVWSFSDFVRDHPRFKFLMGRLGLAHVNRCPVQSSGPHDR